MIHAGRIPELIWVDCGAVISARMQTPSGTAVNATRPPGVGATARRPGAVSPSSPCEYWVSTWPTATPGNIRSALSPQRAPSALVAVDHIPTKVAIGCRYKGLNPTTATRTGERSFDAVTPSTSLLVALLAVGRLRLTRMRRHDIMHVMRVLSILGVFPLSRFTVRYITAVR